jgi:uncharacterized protein YdaU (DUF1376 family)
VNYYPFYVGDYARDTAHLSLAEHGAYRLLLDHQYSTEKPLPTDLEVLQRICRSSTPLERAAVESIANQFFPVGPDGRMNGRAARQIPKERERIDIARANGMKGGRPRKPSGIPNGLSIETQRGAQRQSSPSPSPSPSPEPTPSTKPTAAAKAVKRTAKEKITSEASPAGPKINGVETWEAYSQAYQQRYRTPPVRNASVNAMLCQFVKKLGNEAPQVAAFYLTHNSGYYVGRGHSVRAMLSDAEKLHTEWVTGRKVTQTQARQADQTASNPFIQILEERRREAELRSK